MSINKLMCIVMGMLLLAFLLAMSMFFSYMPKSLSLIEVYVAYIIWALLFCVVCITYYVLVREMWKD